jgi:hypothetical protein
MTDIKTINPNSKDSLQISERFTSYLEKHRIFELFQVIIIEITLTKFKLK